MKRLPRIARMFALVLGFLAFAACAVVFVLRLGKSPSNDRGWLPEQSVLPEVVIDDTLVHIRNVRNFKWSSDADPVPGYYDQTYNVKQLKRVWFALSPFVKDWRGPAHAFLSFEFSDGKFVSISVEGRKEVGEDYSPWKGLINEFELTYVIGDERDLMGLRTVAWKDPVYLYPARTSSPEKGQELFLNLIRRAQQVAQAPEFYSTVGNNCSTNLADAINSVSDRKIRFGWLTVLPGYADQFVLEQGLLDTDLSLEAARAQYKINERAVAAAGDPNFSYLIRGETPPALADSYGSPLY